MRSSAVASLVVVILGAAAAFPAGAGADDPGRWRLAAVDRLPGGYRHGVAADGAGHAFWTGPPDGLYRSSVELQQQLRLRGAIPSALRVSVGAARVGDPAWDRQAGRLLVPLDCAAGASDAGCPNAGIGVFDGGLIWRYHVRLDRAALTRIDWAELSPDRSLLWTSAGSDLLAFHTGDLIADAPEALRPVNRIAGALPLEHVTGSAIWRGRLMLAGEHDGRLQIWSVDVAQGRELDPRLELERSYAGDPLGLAAFDGRGGLLHLIFTPAGAAPTFRGPGASLLSFVPSDERSLELTVARRTLRAGRPASIPVRVYHRFGGRTRPVAGALVRAGRWRALTGEDGAAELRVRPLLPGSLTVQVSKRELTPVSRRLTVIASIGGALAGPPSVSVSGGAARRVLRAARLLDCSGSGGCEALSPPRPRGCIALRGGAQLRIGLYRRPAREVSVLLQGGGRTFLAGRAQPAGRQGLGWRLALPAAVPARGRLELVVIYPDGTGAQLVTRAAAGRC